MTNKKEVTKTAPKTTKVVTEVGREVIDQDHWKIIYSDKSERIIFE